MLNSDIDKGCFVDHDYSICVFWFLILFIGKIIEGQLSKLSY